MTLVEVLVGATILSVLVGGLMASFVTAFRITGVGEGNTEASGYAQQTLERFRNRIACDDLWFGTPSCAFAAPVSTADALPVGALYGGTRTYTVTPEDCDGVIGGPANCLKVVVTLTWTPPS